MYSRVFCGDRSKKPPVTRVYFDELVCGFSQLSKADAKPILYQLKWCPGAEVLFLLQALLQLVSPAKQGVCEVVCCCQQAPNGLRSGLRWPSEPFSCP